MDRGRAPDRIRLLHLQHDGPNFKIERWPSALASLRPALPIELEGLFTSSHDGIRLYTKKGVSPSRPDAGFYHPEQSVPLFQLRAIVFSLEHNEFTRQYLEW